MGSVEERLLLPPPPARSGDAGAGGAKRGKWEKTYLDVLGVCCSAEVALVERLLKPIDGVRAVTVVVPSRTVIVEHDLAAVSQSHIGNIGGADPPPINDGNQSPRHQQGDRQEGGGGSSLQDAAAMIARNNNDGYIAVRTTALADNSTVARMQRLVEAAQNSRSKTQRLVDSCAKYYTPGDSGFPDLCDKEDK
uniref:Heavy metal ATPase 3 isoform 6 n=1 Tax=Zea mays TaxID=4577 RepID=A0A8E5INJ2_MAIZE|nr:heavy metal ATPase 3 isoform 6 [Zea mays]